MSQFDNLEFSIKEGVAAIILDRPAAGNAFNLALATEFNRAANLCQHDPSVRAVVISGNGKLFCAGGDLAAMAEAGDRIDAALKDLTDQCHAAYSTLMRMRAPVIAAINGAAAGIGFSLALAADLSIASEKASFTLAYTAAGLSPDGAATFLLPRLIGMKRSKELILTNRKLNANEALQWGLVNQVVEHDQLMDKSFAIATQLAQGATHAFGSAKQLLLASSTESFESQMVLEAIAIMENAKGSDGQEGINAFLNKRKPHYTGKC